MGPNQHNGMMPASRIVIATGHPLSTNPRVVKEATVLAEAGYEVEVLTTILHPHLAAREEALAAGQRWKPIYLIDNRRQGLGARWRWQQARLRRRLWLEGLVRTGCENVRQLGYSAPEMLAYCLRRQADLYIMHLEQALWVGVELLQRGKRVGVDYEDWFSKDMPAAAQRTRPVELLRRCEGILARQAAYCVTTSNALATALAEAYEAQLPLVVWNAFPWDERRTLDGELRDRTSCERLSVCWFSQTIGPGRGLELLAEATHHTRAPLEIHLRGACSDAYAAQLQSLVHPSVRAHLHIHAQVPHDQLASRLAEHDIGFAGELAECASRDLTITNKVFQYFLSGVPVVASATAGQREVQRATPEAVQLFKIGDARGLAAALERWAAPDARRRAAEAALAAAREQFAWEKCAATIREGVAAALGAPASSGRRQRA